MDSNKTDSGRLREAGARSILADRKAGHTYQTIAAKYAVSIGTVFNVCKGRTWSFLRAETA